MTTPDPLAALRRHFEDEYGKLDISIRKKKRKRGLPESIYQNKEAAKHLADEWQGINDEIQEKPPPTITPQIITFFDTNEANSGSEIALHKTFMSSRATKSANSTTKRQAVRSTSPDEEADNLKNDIALQRLLRESNLLSEAKIRDDHGRFRHKALDARISHLGGNELPKPNIPARIRKGIEARRKLTEEKREREAQEAGIVLPVKRKSKAGKGRDRGLALKSGVGKFKNGTLKIDEKEIRRINNSGSRFSRGGLKLGRQYR